MDDNFSIQNQIVVVMERDPFIQADIQSILRSVMPYAILHFCRDHDGLHGLMTGLRDLTLAVLPESAIGDFHSIFHERIGTSEARALVLSDDAKEEAGGAVIFLPVPFTEGTFRTALERLGF